MKDIQKCLANGTREMIISELKSCNDVGEDSMFDSSIFNYYANISGRTVVFNSMTEKLVCFYKNGLVNSQNLIEYFKDTSEKNKQQLIDSGLIVKSGVNEDRIASVKMLDRIVNRDLYLTIMPTYSCNFGCKYCYERDDNDSSKRHSAIFMDRDIQSKLIKYIKKLLSERLCLIVEWHGGEPLARVDIIDQLSQEFIGLAARMGKPYIATITTNGYFLTEDVVRCMLKNHVIKFHVTIDGFAWNHDSYRPDIKGNPTFDRIMKNLLVIKERICQKNFHIILRTNVTKSFLPKLDEWLKFLSDTFADDSRFQIYVKMVEDKGGHVIENLRSDLLESEKEIYDIICASKYKNNYDYYYQALCSSMCSAGMRNKHIIAPDGRIKKCGHYLFDERSDVGVLREDGDIEYDREHFSKWIKAVKERPVKCSKCPLWAACFNLACPLKTNFLEGSDEPPICSGEHQNISSVLNILLGPFNTGNIPVQTIL